MYSGKLREYAAAMFDRFFFTHHLEEEEHIVHVVHKHWLIGCKLLMLPLISFVCAWGLFSYWAITSPSHTRLAILLLSSWAIASLVWLFRNFLDFYLDAWIVTNHGIIDLEWLGWFHRQSSRILYSDIQGISYEIHGILGTLLRFGTVTVEKISTGSTVSLECAPYPRAVESAVLESMEAYMHSKNLKNASHVQELLSQFVAGTVQEKAVHGKIPDPASSASTSRPTKKSFSTERVGSSRV